MRAVSIGLHQEGLCQVWPLKCDARHLKSNPIVRVTKGSARTCTEQWLGTLGVACHMCPEPLDIFGSMNGKCRTMKRRMNSLHVWATLVLGVLLAGCIGTPIEVVNTSLVGAWHGECKISLPVVFNPNQVPENVERTHTMVDLDITIHEDATVEGTLGEATLEECVLKLNRGDLGRSLNIASDYIIADGHLAGPIVSGQDANDLKEFTIPFDLVDGRMHGGLMWVQDWKYPYPLCQLDLERTLQGNQRGTGLWPASWGLP